VFTKPVKVALLFAVTPVVWAGLPQLAFFLWEEGVVGDAGLYFVLLFALPTFTALAGAAACHVFTR
jgi:hypothetical protein